MLVDFKCFHLVGSVRFSFSILAPKCGQSSICDFRGCENFERKISFTLKCHWLVHEKIKWNVDRQTKECSNGNPKKLNRFIWVILGWTLVFHFLFHLFVSLNCCIWMSNKGIFKFIRCSLAIVNSMYSESRPNQKLETFGLFCECEFICHWKFTVFCIHAILYTNTKKKKRKEKKKECSFVTEFFLWL